MATNHTEHYQLNLWEPTDYFLREEFNENFQRLDAALETYKTVTGTYTGTKAEQTISVGFRPRLLLVLGVGSIGMKTEMSGCTAVNGGSVTTSDLILTDDGFEVKRYERYLNEKETTYSYIAFR